MSSEYLISTQWVSLVFSKNVPSGWNVRKGSSVSFYGNLG